MSHRTLMAAATPLLLTPLASAHDNFASLATGDQVIPPVVTSTVGYASFELHSEVTGPELHYTLVLPGLDLDGLQTPLDPLDDVTGIHIHVGAEGAAGPHGLNIFGAPAQHDADMTFDPLTSTITGTWDDGDAAGTPPGGTQTLTALIPELLSSGLYYQLHTGAAPAGEIRGQIEPAFRAVMSGDNFVPPTGSANLGYFDCNLRATPTGPELDYMLWLPGFDLDGLQTPVDPLDDVTGIHIHVGAPGGSGPHGLNIFGAPAQHDAQMIFNASASTIIGTWDDGDAAGTPPGGTQALSALLTELFEDGLYIQMHTGAFPAGEIRGDIDVGPAQPGTWDDILLETGVNGVLTSGPTGGGKRALAGDQFNARITSPNGTLSNGIPILWCELYTNNMLPEPVLAPLFAGSHLEPNNALLLFNGLVGPFGPFAVGSGIEVNYLVNPGLVGLTAKIQATVVDVNTLNGFVGFSEAHDLRFD